MKPSYTRTGVNYLPVIVHENGHREVLYGDPLVNRITARRYAQFEIRERVNRKAHHKPLMYDRKEGA